MSKFLRALEQAEHDEAMRRDVATSVDEAIAPDVAPPDGSGDVTPNSVDIPPARDRSSEPTRLADTRSPWAADIEANVVAAASEELDEHLVSLLTPSSFEAEQYRALRYQIELRHKTSSLSVVAVSSPGASDGKTTTAINLAGALAQGSDARVLLIDADLRRGSLAARLGLTDIAQPGLVDAIVDATLSLDAVVQTRRHVNLSVITAGRLPVTPYEVLKSPRLGQLLAEARRRFDYVILDTPPLVSVPDCRVIGKWVDGFLVVVTAHRTARKLLEEALKVMEPATIVGLVFNGDDRHLSRDAYPSTRRSRST